MIKLKTKDTKQVIECSVEEAEFLLRLPYSAFELADDNYEYTDATIRRKSKKADSRAEDKTD